MDPLVERFARLLARDASAPVCNRGSQVVDRGGLDARARALEAELAPRLRDRAPPIAALAVANGPWFLAALLATRRAGAIALLLDETTPARALRALAKAHGAGVLVRGGRDDGGLPAVRRLTGSAPAACPLATAVQKLTSGSTGAPRAIAQGAAALCADADQLQRTMGLRAGDRALALVPMSFSYGLSSLAVPALTHGLVLLLPASAGPRAPLAAARAGAATFLPATPSLVQAIGRQRKGALPPALRLVISAGAPLSPIAARRFRDRHGLFVHAFYGASECGGICFDRDGDAAEHGLVGPPVDGVDVTLTGRERLVAVRSPALALGYLPDPDPALDGTRFRTSDCGRFEAGSLRLLGRTGELINVDGRKVHPREVEAVLARLTGVDDALVLRTLRAGHESEAGHAIVACSRGSLTPQQVLAWCRAHLPYYKVPRAVSLVRAIPRDDRGKPDRASLGAWARL